MLYCMSKKCWPVKKKLGQDFLDMLYVADNCPPQDNAYNSLLQDSFKAKKLDRIGQMAIKEHGFFV